MPNRFRIAHTLEDADDGADLIVPASSYTVVHCTWCQQRQYGEPWDHCMFCNRPLSQDGWICAECGHRNPDDARECESCGRRMPTW